MIVKQVLCEILNKFFTNLELTAIRIEDADLLEESFSEKFILDIGSVHLLDKCEDFYNL
jgi:hypothetical protein